MQTVVEDTVTTKRVANPLGAYLNAKYRSRTAVNSNKDFFASDEHMDRVDAVTDIIRNFFGCEPSYVTARANGGRPFDAIKVEAAGYRIARISRTEKQTKLYGPLDAIGGVTYKVTNGHLIVRVY
jgi:hypothetical protein